MSDTLRTEPGNQGPDTLKSRRFGFVFLFFLIAVLFAASTGFHIDQYTRVMGTSEEIRQLEDQLNELKEKRKRMEMRKSELFDYESIYSEAKESGMEYPSSIQLHWLQLDDENREKR